MYKVKMRWKRLRVKWRRWKRSLDNSIKPESSKLTAYEEKGIRLWKMVVRDEDTQMALNSSGVRQIEKDTLFITVAPHNGSDRYTMTIMDITSSRRSLYELHFDGKHANNVCESFDIEMDRRMRKVEMSKRNLIETDIDKLISAQNKTLEKQAKEREEKRKKEQSFLNNSN
jgi:hypothetical protein